MRLTPGEQTERWNGVGGDGVMGGGKGGIGWTGEMAVTGERAGVHAGDVTDVKLGAEEPGGRKGECSKQLGGWVGGRIAERREG